MKSAFINGLGLRLLHGGREPCPSRVPLSSAFPAWGGRSVPVAASVCTLRWWQWEGGKKKKKKLLIVSLNGFLKADGAFYNQWGTAGLQQGGENHEEIAPQALGLNRHLRAGNELGAGGSSWGRGRARGRGLCSRFCAWKEAGGGLQLLHAAVSPADELKTPLPAEGHPAGSRRVVFCSEGPGCSHGELQSAKPPE